MNDSTIAAWQIVPPAEGYVFDLGSWYDRFAQLPDGRKARGKRYALALILLRIVRAKLSGEDTPSGIAEWARLRQAELIQLFSWERASLPGHNTYRRVADRAVEPSQLQTETSAFLTSRPGAGHSVLVSLAGKTLRGTIWRKDPSAVHRLAAYLPHEGLVLMQVAVEHHENEISVAPQVLKCLDLRGKTCPERSRRIVMGDALHTSSCARASRGARCSRAAQDIRALSIQILDAGGDYL